MSRWGELIPHDEEAAEEGRCLCGCQDDEVEGEEHDFQRGEDHVQRCVKCTLPHAYWAGGPCPGSDHPLRPGKYV